MATSAADFVDRLADAGAGGAPFDVVPELSRLTLRILGRCLFERDLTDEADAVGGALKVVLHHTIEKLAALFPLPGVVPTPKNLRFRAALRALDRVVLSLIAERRRDGADRGDLLSMLLAARDEETGEGLDDRQLRDEVMTLLLAGHETTAMALSWTFYLLSLHPGPRRTLEQELDGALPAGAAAAPDDLPRLRYTRMVLDESLRLYPPAWVVDPIGRRGRRDRRLRDPVRLARAGEPVRHPPRSRSVGRSGGVRPGAVRARARGRASALRVFPVRRRAAPLHRRRLRPDGGDHRARDRGPPAAPGPRTGAAGGDRSAGHAAPEAGHLDDGARTLTASAVDFTPRRNPCEAAAMKMKTSLGRAIAAMTMAGAGCIIHDTGAGAPVEAVGGNLVPASSLKPMRQAAAAAHRRIGTALMSDRLANGRVRALVAREFDSLTPENEMKWVTIEPEPGTFRFDAGDKLVAFAAENGMRMRGHTLVWHSQLAYWVKGLKADALRAAMARHIQGVVGHWKGKIAQWDVVNEAIADGDSGQLRPDSPFAPLGPTFIDEAFRLAHAADPQAELIYNDYEIEGGNTPKGEAAYALCKRLKEAGVPITGVGFQMHVDPRHWPTADQIRTNLERYAALGLTIEITEMDVPVGIRRRAREVSGGDHCCTP